VETPRKEIPPMKETTNIFSIMSPLAQPAKRQRDVTDQKLPAQRIVVHITGTSTYINAALRGVPPLDHLEDYFDDAGRPFAHYSVDPWGRVRQHAPENETPWAQGWGALGGRDKLLKDLYAGRRGAPEWWVDEHVGDARAVAGAFARLFPEGTPNDRSIAVEFIQWQKGHAKRVWVPDGPKNYKLTVAQYLVGNMLCHDIALRHGIPWPVYSEAKRTPAFLGHEDCDPWGRGTKAGGWDPGALRTSPRFCWQCFVNPGGIMTHCKCAIPTPEIPGWAR
jgi:hypothetical protein